MTRKEKNFFRIYEKFLDLMEKALDFSDKHTKVLTETFTYEQLLKLSQTDEKVKILFDRAVEVQKRVDKI